METVVLQCSAVQCSGDDFNDLVSNSDTIHAKYNANVYCICCMCIFSVRFIISPTVSTTVLGVN